MNEQPPLDHLRHSVGKLSQKLDLLLEEVAVLRSESSRQHSLVPERLSGEEVAKLLKIQPSTVRKCWADFGLVRVGRASHGRHLYSRDSVLRHIREREQGGY